MKGKTSGTVAKEMEAYELLTTECHERLKKAALRNMIKKANRTQAKDMWYEWHCETCGEEFTEHGEQEYASSDDADW